MLESYIAFHRVALARTATGCVIVPEQVSHGAEPVELAVEPDLCT
jgi:hypothetical protein